MKGLVNLGNTCYLNAALQCLLFCPPLTNYVLAGLADRDLHPARVNACALAAEYFALTRAYWAPAPAADPSPPAPAADPTPPAPPALDTRPLWAAFTRLSKQFANAMPHDAHEALVLLLKHLHDALARTPRVHPCPAWRHVHRDAWEAHCTREGYSMLTDIFQGQMECTVRAAADAAASVTHEHFTGLALDGHDALDVQGALDAHLRPVRIDGGDATQTKAMRYAPLVLVLHLHRVPVVTPRVHVPGAGGGDYALFAACEYDGGHYVATCETRSRWYLLDDATSVQVAAPAQRRVVCALYKKC